MAKQHRNALLRLYNCMITRMALFVTGISVLLSVLPSTAMAATQVTKNTITWTFDRDYQVGQFANGDYWVLDTGTGVKVTAVSPAPAGSGGTYRNGSMVNPVGPTYQGYDGRVDGYSSSLSIAFPATLHGGDSLVSTQSRVATANSTDIMGATVTPDQGYLQRAAVLTVVSSAPAATSFRPPYAGKQKPIYSTTQLNRSLLLGLPLTTKPSVTYLNQVNAYFQNVWLDHKVGWSTRMMHPISNMPDYGREIGLAVSQASVLLTLDYTSTEIEPLLINFVQLGIDLYGMSQNGVNWGADGGHNNGRKWPIVFAGIMLNNAQMKAVKVAFGEDDQTYYGVTPSANAGQSYVAYFGRDCVSAYQTNGCTGVGTKDCRSSTKNADACQDYRNCCTSHTWVGEALAARLMNAKSTWGHDAFFDYVDRWMGYGKDPVVGAGDWVQPGAAGATFISDMWKMYRPALDGQTNAGPKANAGTDISVVDSGSGSASVTLDGSASADSDGTITSYTWSESGQTIASGQKPTVTLAVGTHTITLTVVDNDGASSTDTVVVTVTALAKAAPTVKSVVCRGASVEVTFDKDLTSTSAQRIANYSIDKSITISKATYQSASRLVVLTTSTHTDLEMYNLTLSGITDTSGNVIVTTTKEYAYSSGIVGYWDFTETSGSTVADWSGLDNNGSMVGGAALTGHGQVSLTAVTQSVQVPTNGMSAAAGSVAVHVLLNSATGAQYFFGHATSGMANRIQLYANDGSLSVGLGDSHTTAIDIASLALQTWYDIALTWNGSQYAVYLDGVNIATGTYTGLTSLNSFVDIGNNGYTATRNLAMNGLVDNVRIYNRALSAAEVTKIYNKERVFLFQTIGNKVVDEGSTLTFTAAPQYSGLQVYLQADNLPGSPAMVGNVFTWTPTYDDAGTYTATFGADYGTNSDSETITITVSNVDRAPALSGVASRTISEGQKMAAVITATDADGQTPTIVAANLPRGATFASGTFSWTPGYDQAGVYSVQFTASDGELTDSRSMTITVLDASGTAASTVVIDNGSANTSSTGTWASSSAAGYYGTDSVWSRDGATYTWTFRPTASGSCQLSMCWTAWSSRSTRIPVSVQDSTGTTTVYVNQQINGGAWNLLGTYSFVAGNAYKITITAQAGPSSTCADAVKLAYTTTAVADTIVDNTDAATSRTGTWTSSSAAGHYGTESLWSRDGATFTWRFTPAKTGQYNVSMWWTAWSTRSTRIPVTIANSAGTATVYINQQSNGGAWNLLGTYNFTAGTTYTVTIVSQAYPTSTCADAVKFAFVQ
jgi:hypothetical protein